MQEITYSCGPINFIEHIGTSQELDNYGVSRYVVSIYTDGNSYWFEGNSENELMQDSETASTK